MQSRKMEKLLAALSLPQVGEIRTIPASEDPEKKEGLFALELNTRVYTLRAETSQDAAIWVETLNGLRDRDDKNNGEVKSPMAIESNKKEDTSKGTSTEWKKASKPFGCC